MFSRNIKIKYTVLLVGGGGVIKKRSVRFGEIIIIRIVTLAVNTLNQWSVVLCFKVEVKK